MYYWRAKAAANYSDITTAGGSAVSWTRSGNTITINKVGHGLVNGDIIAITVSSGIDVLPLGDYTVTKINDDSFSITYDVSDVKLVSHFNGADGVTDYTAETGQEFTFIGTAQLDTAYKALGSASLLLDGNSDAVSFANSDDVNFGSGSFTIKARIRPISGAGVYNTIYEHFTDGSNYHLLREINGEIYFDKLGGTEIHISTSGAGITSGNFYDIELSRNGNDWKFFVNGVIKYSGSISTALLDYTGNPSFGGSATIGQWFNGHIDETLIIKGRALHTAEFTIEDYEYYATSGTCTYTNYVWYDASPAGNKYDTKPDSDDDVTIVSTNQCTLSANESALSITINASTTLSLATFNLDVGGLTTINGTLIIGASAGTGLTTVGLTANSGSHINMQITSKINNSSHLDIYNSSIFTTNYTGSYTQTNSGNYVNRSFLNSWYNFVLNEGATLTFYSATSVLTHLGSNSLIINGTLNLGSSASIGVSATGIITFGINSDITGAATLLINATIGSTITNNKANAFSFTGSISYRNSNTIILAWNFLNVTIEIRGSSVNCAYRFSSGTLKCKDFTISNNNTGNAVLDCSANPSFEISGNIDLNAGTGVYTTVWTKGTGTITLKGSSGTQTLDLDNQVLEDIILDCAGAEKQIVVGGTTDSLSGTGGTLNSSVAGTQRTLICAGTGVCSNVTFKDISVGSANKVNAKNSCTNQGNCLGIVFKDVVK